jgi:hypothetical protein
MPLITEKNLIPNHQFGFRGKHAIVEQIHRTNKIILAFETRKYCFALFLDIL